MMSRKDFRPYSQAKSAGSFSPVGEWENELGSTMKVESFNGTNFSGSYTSAVSSGGSSVSGTLSGTVAGDAIAFTVNWCSEFQSVTAWSGLILSAGQTVAIYALWHLSSTPEEEASAWASIQAGADLFLATAS